MIFFNRIISALIDMIFSGCIPIIIILVFIIINDYNNIIVSVFLFSVAYNTFICKDLIFSGRSIGKRIMKLAIFDKQNNRPSMIKLVLRNILSFIWPLELIVCLINPEKKIEDILFKTRVIYFIEYIEKRSFKYINILGIFIISLLIHLILFYLLASLMYQHYELFKLLYTT